MTHFRLGQDPYIALVRQEEVNESRLRAVPSNPVKGDSHLQVLPEIYGNFTPFTSKPWYNSEGIS